MMMATTTELIKVLKEDYPDTLDGVTQDNIDVKRAQVEMVKHIVLLCTAPPKRKPKNLKDK